MKYISMYKYHNTLARGKVCCAIICHATILHVYDVYQLEDVSCP